MISEKLLYLLEIKDKKIALKRRVIISFNFWDILKEYLNKFVTKLLELKRFNMILNIINRLINKRYYIIYTTIDKNIITKNTARILYKNMWRIYNLFSIIILNRDS